MGLSGKVEAEVELKSPADNFYKMWRSETHNMPDITSTHLQGIKVREGNWDTHGSIKVWDYTIDGKKEVFKEKVLFDDSNLIFELHGIEGHMFDYYRVFKPTCKLIPKAGGSLAKLAIEYEKYEESGPTPENYMTFFSGLIKDTDAYISSTS